MLVPNRRDIRYRYHLKGDNVDDCWKTLICPWCAIVQEEREVRLRQEKERNEPVPYQSSQEMMTYAARS